MKKNFVVLALMAGLTLSFSLVSCGGKAALIGTWVTDNAGPGSGIPSTLELFKDGTGNVYWVNNAIVSACTWRIPEEGHLQIDTKRNNNGQPYTSTDVFAFKRSGAALIINTGSRSTVYKKQEMPK